MKVLGIVGSLRKASFNRSLMNAFLAQKPEGVDVEVADISVLPFYNDDIAVNYPAVAQALKTQVENADVVIIATPEYNRSVPGVLKNAIDWLSRPYGKNSFNGKRVLVVGASTGATGASMAQYDLKKMLLHGNAEIFGQPEFFLGLAGSKFDEAGNLTEEDTKGYIANAWNRIIG